MFNENLKIIRKAKGYTQEELAIKIHVVRQTISKWEKGLSVPDADMLSKLADVLEINVSELLGSEIKEETNKNEVAEQLAKISEQLALKNRRRKRIWKVIGFILLAVIVINMLLVVLGTVTYNEKNTDITTIEEKFRFCSWPTVDFEYIEWTIHKIGKFKVMCMFYCIGLYI